VKYSLSVRPNNGSEVKRLQFDHYHYGRYIIATECIPKLGTYKKSTTIFCSQYEFEDWYEQLGGEASPLADAIIDLIAHDSYRIKITSIDKEHDVSMREVYGLDKALRE
jgi:hypothetical protein